MSASLHRLYRLASGPRRLQADLQASAAALRDLKVASQLPLTAATSLAPTLASGPILELVGSRLRPSLVAPPPPGTATGERGQRTTQAAAARESSARQSAPPTSPAQYRTAARLSNFAEHDSETGRTAASFATSRRPARRLEAPSAPTHHQGSHGVDAVPTARPAGRSTPPTPPPPPSTPTCSPADREAPSGRESALVRQLSRYWQLPRGSSEARRTPGGPAAPLHEPPQLPELSGAAPQQNTHAPGWERLAAEGSVRGLAEAVTHRRPSRSAHQVPAGEATVEIQNVFNVAVRSEAIERSDLAEQLAELLHEQVVRHGIELS